MSWREENAARILSYHERRLADRDVQDLHAMARSVVYDLEVSDSEIRMLTEWLDAHAHLAGLFPIGDLMALMRDILADGVVTPDERRQLLEFLQAIATPLDGSNSPADNIFDPVEGLYWRERRFCFTGALRLCTREQAHGYIARVRGIPEDGVTRKTDYLVVGDLGAGSWIHSRYGRKIERVIQDRNAGKCSTLIVDEYTFTRFYPTEIMVTLNPPFLPG